LKQPAIRKKTEEEAIKEFEQSQVDNILHAEVTTVLVRNPTPPTSVRLSAPLLESLDRIAARQHRKRGSLIQHILWEYVRTHPRE
jgi:hypothetical protein